MAFTTYTLSLPTPSLPKPSLPTPLRAIGNAEFLSTSLLALFCSNRCPASLILQAHDLAHQFVEQGLPVISGFHTSVEKEMLTVLLRGKQPIVYCPARSIDHWRIPKELRPAIEGGRMLVVSPFSSNHERITSELAFARNQFVAKLASKIFVVYAAAESKTAALCAELVAGKKIVYTIESQHTNSLITLGAKPFTIESLGDLLSN